MTTQLTGGRTMTYLGMLTTAALLAVAMTLTGCPEETPATPDADVDAGCVGDGCTTIESGLTVLSGESRACEVLVRDAAASVSNVTFSSGVIGTFVRRAPNTAITFHSVDDAAIGAGAVELGVVGDVGTDLELVTSDCFDRLGVPLSGAGVAINP